MRERGGLPFRGSAGAHATVALRGDHPRDALPDRDLRVRAAVVPDDAEVPPPQVRPGRGRNWVVSLLAGKGGLRLRTPPSLDGYGLRRSAPERGLPRPRPYLLHRR